MHRSRDVQRALFLVGSQKELDLAPEGDIVAAPRLQPRRAMFFRHVEGVVEDRIDRGTTVRGGIARSRAWV